MRQLLLDKKDLVVKEASQPLLGDHSILVSVHYAYISSDTKIDIIKTQESFFNNVPQKVKRVLEAVASNAIGVSSRLDTRYTLGYSCSGHVVSVGRKVRKFAPGDLVACTERGYMPYGDLICIPERFATRVFKKEYLKAASLAAVAGIAFQGVRRAQLQLGEYVAIFGLGLLGQLTIQLAKRAGCTVIAIGESRLELAYQFGADLVLNGLEDDIIKEVDLITERYGVDVSIITDDSKNPDVLNNAFRLTRQRGRIVLTGDKGIQLNHNHFEPKDIDILVSATHYEQPHQKSQYVHKEQQNMHACLQLIEQGELKLETLIKEEVGIKELSRAYQQIKQNKTIGVVLSYDQPHKIIGNIEKIPIIRNTSGFVPAISDKLRVGIIGAGEFAQSTLIPLITKIRNVEINAIVDTDLRNSIRVSKLFDAPKACAQVEELFQDDFIDIVIIASPHVFHCEQIIRSITHGKAVFAEKPMVTDFVQLQQLHAVLKKHNSIPFCVDYNRSFSPFIQKIKKVLLKRRTPIMVNYRINAGFLAKKHWMHSNVGAGRIIGEVSPIIDLFCYLTESTPISVSVEAMHAQRDDIFPTDNFSTHISFDDGSVCSLIFTALGHPDVGSERMEIFFDEKAIVLQDFMELYGFGLPSWFNETVSTPDLGHEALINHFFHALKLENFKSPISLKRLYTAAEITLLIDQLACEGGGKKEL